MKIAEIGDIVVDKHYRVGTVISSTNNSFSIKYSSSIMKFKYDSTIKTIEQAGFSVSEKHIDVLSRQL